MAFESRLPMNIGFGCHSLAESIINGTLHISITVHNVVLIYSVLDPTLIHTICTLQKCDRPITSFPVKSV
jgi:hypothetical protein